MKKTWSILLLLGAISVQAQTTNRFSFKYDQTPSIQIEGRQLGNPWAGGLNAPQYSTIRLNRDSRNDLAIFDRTTSKVSTFVAMNHSAGKGSIWQYAPVYETIFPADLSGWMLLVDYDGDNRKDLFTSASGGVRVFRNELKNGKTVFTLVADPLMSEGFSSRFPLFMYSSDIPAILDYDEDGDIDIITFDPTGNTIAYQQNMSVERTGRKGGLDFKRYPNLCWGHFQKEYCNDFTFGFQCGDGSGRWENRGGKNRSEGDMLSHLGTVVSKLDSDEDGKKNKLLGYVSYQNSNRLRNTGTNVVKANFTSFDSLFPTFLSTSSRNVDGVRDLQASPHINVNENGILDVEASTGSDRRGKMDRPDEGRPMHTGNTITMLDTDGDSKKDMLFGFVSCQTIARLRNTGTNDVRANFTSFDSLFPVQAPILFPAFPSTFWEDVDGDGVKDLLASPNVSTNENGVFDFRASAWLYRNTGTNQKPDFQLIQKDFLQDNMLDLGERAAPALADLDGDGDMDLLIGFSGIGIGAGRRASLWHFENTGTVKRPAFSLVTKDYLGIGQSLRLTNTVPSFADVDNNGTLDLVLLGTGTSEVEVRILFNTAPLGNGIKLNLSAAIRWPTRDLLSPSDLLTVSDVDRDGQVDLLISNASRGMILYYRNAGSATTPVFQLQNQTVGGFTTDDYIYANARSLVIVDLNGDQKNEVLVAAQNGTVHVYQYPDAIDQPFVLLDSLSGLGKPGSGLIATMADLDGDQLPDLLLGSLGGGLRYLKNRSVKQTPDFHKTR